MKKILRLMLALCFITGVSFVNVNANSVDSSRASSTKRCILPIRDDYRVGNDRFESELTLVITIRVNDSTGVITSYDAYLNVGWVAVTNPNIAYTGQINSINVSKSLSSSGRVAYATASYDILGRTFFDVQNVSYHVTGKSLSCS